MRVSDVFCAVSLSGTTTGSSTAAAWSRSSCCTCQRLPSFQWRAIPVGSDPSRTQNACKHFGFETCDAVVHGFGVFCVVVRRCAMWRNCRGGIVSSRVSPCWLLAGSLRFRFLVFRLRLLLPRSVLVVLPSLLSRGVTLDISTVFSHVSVVRSRAYGMFKTLRVLWTPCWLHPQLRRCTWTARGTSLCQLDVLDFCGGRSFLRWIVQ